MLNKKRKGRNDRKGRSRKRKPAGSSTLADARRRSCGSVAARRGLGGVDTNSARVFPSFPCSVVLIAPYRKVAAATAAVRRHRCTHSLVGLYRRLRRHRRHRIPDIIVHRRTRSRVGRVHRIESWPERAVTLRRVARQDPVSPRGGGGQRGGEDRATETEKKATKRGEREREKEGTSQARARARACRPTGRSTTTSSTGQSRQRRRLRRGSRKKAVHEDNKGAIEFRFLFPRSASRGDGNT